MFGEFIFVAGATLVISLVEKSLEELGKEKHAKFLGFGLKAGLGVYAAKQLNEIVKEASDLFL